MQRRRQRTARGAPVPRARRTGSAAETDGAVLGGSDPDSGCALHDSAMKPCPQGGASAARCFAVTGKQVGRITFLCEEADRGAFGHGALKTKGGGDAERRRKPSGGGRERRQGHRGSIGSAGGEPHGTFGGRELPRCSFPGQLWRSQGHIRTSSVVSSAADAVKDSIFGHGQSRAASPLDTRPDAGKARFPEGATWEDARRALDIWSEEKRGEQF